MVKKINLREYNFNMPATDYRVGETLRKVRKKAEREKANQYTGLVTYGIIEVTQGSGGWGWAISDYIEFSYYYNRRPIFTYGIDGTIQLPENYEFGEDNNYGQDLPEAITTLYDDCVLAEDFTTYQPSIFIPRIVHWHIVDRYFLGCYVLVTQINENSTETDKTCRLHYRFEGPGFKKES